MVIIVLTFLFIDMFDTMGTPVGVCTKAGMMSPNGKIHGLNKAFMADAVATVTGACFGTSTTTTYVESASGVAQGGRTGLTAFVTAVCFPDSIVLRSPVPVSSCCRYHSCARHRGLVYDVAHQGYQYERLCRVDSCLHHHRDDAAHI